MGVSLVERLTAEGLDRGGGLLPTRLLESTIVRLAGRAVRGDRRASRRSGLSGPFLFMQPSCHPQLVSEAVVALMRRARSCGESSICRPRWPALTWIVGKSNAEASSAADSFRRCPSGLIPPRT